MPDLSAVLKEAFPLGGIAPTVRRWWPLVLTGIVAALAVWAATEQWLSVTAAETGLPLGYTGVGTPVGELADATTGGGVAWGYVTAGCAVVALILVAVATFRPGLVLGRTVASGLLGLAALLSIAVWLAPSMMVTVADLPTRIGPPGVALTLAPRSGLITTIAVTAVGAAVLFMGRRNRPWAEALGARR